MNRLEKESKRIHKQIGFKKAKKVYEAGYYSSGTSRNVIYTGECRNKPTAFKYYDDYRITDEPISLKRFHEHNKSKILTAPELIDYKIINSKRGWFVMEKLPDNARNYSSPINKAERKEFINLFLEYKKNFPKKPTRRLLLGEQLPPNKFNIARMNKWFLLANDKFSELKDPEINPREFIPRFVKALDIVEKEFRNRKMVWIHGHFKPKEIFKVSDKKFYLTDFAHTHCYPEGYELAFIIWADWLITADWKLKYSEWRRGVFSWIDDLEPVARKLKIKNYEKLIFASIIERIMGSITADIFLSQRSRQEKLNRIKLLYNLFDELVKKY